MNTTQKLLTYAKMHGFNAILKKDGIIIDITWYDPTTKKQGITGIKCDDMKQLRDALGY